MTMTIDITRREIVDDLNRLANTLEKTAQTYENISALPIVQLMRQAEQAEKFAPKFNLNSPAFAIFRHAERYGRDLERLAESKPTRWKPPKY
ncbi:MAG: hypothetical protein KGK01_04255 [Bradyrhizobium sp.]|uniref:hypothetical protein n=1 Tax=Bradyrhizobium sp. TaxID=376 RepID=UPI002399DA50|nr:hypothetical protein [Bradyrhizobium sp.]MDE2068860.1 hypothetical protein [Bradyrhizobium sp.]MDE2241670.1 hypothetical protein [Bradyrhizobium sp.]MDE2470414.1 hypothetical protein [Bradyrhizobium sp.]